MKFRYKYRPHFLKRELGFLFGLFAAMAILFVHGDDAISSVLKMPKPLPDIVKSYKSVTLHAKKAGMYPTGVQFQRGDFMTILAEGSINVFPGRGREFIRGPKAALLFRFGKKGFARHYDGPALIETPEDGVLHLGYAASAMYFSGNPVRPEYYEDDTGAYTVDVIVWGTKDRNLPAKFFEQASQSSPKDAGLKEIVREFRSWLEITETDLQRWRDADIRH